MGGEQQVYMDGMYFRELAQRSGADMLVAFGEYAEETILEVGDGRGVEVCCMQDLDSDDPVPDGDVIGRHVFVLASRHGAMEGCVTIESIANICLAMGAEKVVGGLWLDYEDD